MRIMLLLFVVVIPLLLSGCFYWDYVFRDKEEEKVYEDVLKAYRDSATAE